jgi:release factor glutamine methyltransferase
LTVNEALAKAAERLSAAGVEHASADAELLLRHVVGWDRASVVARGLEPLPDRERMRFFWLVEHRAARQPVQHLTGTQAFWRHDFVVGPEVLIPRPETEILVEQALRLVASVARPRIADVGTGSGCIAVSLAAERPDAVVVGSDISPTALRVAASNAARLLAASRVPFACADLTSAYRAESLDLVVSNPPYVTAAEWSGLAVEVRDHDPRRALVPDEGVPAIYARLVSDAARVLRPGGSVAVEVGAGQAEMVSGLAAAAGFVTVRRVTDLAGIPRVVIGARPRG